MIDVTGMCLPCLLSQSVLKLDPRFWNAQVVLVECTAVLYLVSAVPSTGFRTGLELPGAWRDQKPRSDIAIPTSIAEQAIDRKINTSSKRLSTE